MKYLIYGLIAVSLAGCISSTSYAKKPKQQVCEPVNLWISAEDVPVKITLTDGTTVLSVASGDVVSMAVPGDYLIKVELSQELLILPLPETEITQ